MEIKEYDYVFKVCLMGSSGAGKTSLIVRFIDKVFKDNTMNTIGVDFRMIDLVVDKKQVKLQIWDTSGQERFKSLSYTYARNADAYIFVYDGTDKKSFEETVNCLEEVKHNVGMQPNNLLLCNKSDLEQNERFEEEATLFAKNQNMAFFKTSAMSGENVESSFLELTRSIMGEYKSDVEMFKKENVRITRVVPIGKKNDNDCGC